jgi:hypothetical protein
LAAAVIALCSPGLSACGDSDRSISDAENECAVEAREVVEDVTSGRVNAGGEPYLVLRSVRYSEPCVGASGAEEIDDFISAAFDLVMHTSPAALAAYNKAAEPFGFPAVQYLPAVANPPGGTLGFGGR